MPRLPDTIGKYRIVERLGRGGMSVLYRAEHPTLETPVVIKKLTLKGDAAHRERFRREASLLMEIRHENVVGVFDHFREGSGHFLVMEFVDGRPLSELLAREGALPAAEAAWLVGQVARALEHIHAQGVVHRDLKPSNVLLGRSGTVKLADFGIAFSPAGTEDITAEGTALGTPSFMAPEQLEDARAADERSDLWSLGVCFFELVTGRKFVSGPTPAAVRESLAGAVRSMPGRLPADLPNRHRRFLRRALRMNPDRRLSSGSSAIRLLGSLRSSSGPPPSLRSRLDDLMASTDASPESPTPPAPQTLPDGGEPKPRRRGLVVAAAAFAFLVLAVLLVGPPGRIGPLRASSHGRLVLELSIPEDLPEAWLDGAAVRIYRRTDDGLDEAAAPTLRRSRDGRVLRSRSLALAAGAYRAAWSLGDQVSWQSFGVTPGRDARMLTERLGSPPTFPLELEWAVVDAVDGRDLGRTAVLAWDRTDGGGTELESGGSYRFTVECSGYRSETFALAVSPWRRSLRLSSGLWPVPGRLRVVNASDRILRPRLDGRSRYLDLGGAPESRRIRRLNRGESRDFLLLPGDYRFQPGLGEAGSADFSIAPDGTTTVRVESAEGGEGALESRTVGP